MSRDSPKMSLGAFLMAGGHHIGAWRHPQAHARAGVDIGHFIALAQLAERSGFDLLFVEDAAAIRERDPRLAGRAARSTGFEPLSLLAALALNTSYIGLVATASTTYNDPYALARTFASLDQLSGGRVGWNLVTSASDLEAENFASSGLRPHATRYARAEEFADVVVDLWNSVGEGAYTVDVKSGVYADRAKLRPVMHRGEHFQVQGLLDSRPSPQGRPVMVQAGASDAGKNLAARTADVVFCAAQTLTEAQAFYADLKQRMAAFGRETDDLKILPGLSPIVASSAREARAKYAALQDLIPDEVGVALLASYLSIQDLSRYPLDGPLPEMPPTDGIQSRQQLIIDLGRREQLSIRQLARHFAGARGHWQVIGTPQTIVDEMEARFRGGAADGFNIMPPMFPGGLEDFTLLVVPELRRRGLFREAYQGRTLRQNLGLRMPLRIERASAAQAAHAGTLLDEYYHELGILLRDTPEALGKFLTEVDSALWIAYVGDVPAGCVVLRPLAAFPSSAECKRLYVRARFRRRHIAEALLRVMEEHARTSGLSAIYLDSKDDLTAALSLYRARGYEPCERYNDNVQATVFLSKTL